MAASVVPGTHHSDLFSPQQVEDFHRQGFSIVRSIADADQLQRMRESTQWWLGHGPEPAEFEADLQYPGAPESRAERGGNTVRRLLQAHARDPVFTTWLNQPRIVGRLQQLFHQPVLMPLAHHNCIMTKQPRFSSDTGWHQDIRYWSFERPELISVWLGLGHETLDNGCLRLIPGSHQMRFENHQLDERRFLREDVEENQRLIDSSVAAELNPGDVLFFHCRTLHAATRNFTDEPKLSVVFTFRPLDNPPIANSRSASLPELLFPDRLS